MKVIAYKAELIVSGTEYMSSIEHEFYKEKRTVYAETIPALLDEMVVVSHVMSQDLKRYLAQNLMGEELDAMKQSTPGVLKQWYFTANRPMLLTEVKLNDDACHSSGSALTDPESIVRSMVHYRHMDIERAVWELHFFDSALPEWKKSEGFYTQLSSDDMNEVMSAGFTGEALQEYFNSIPQQLEAYAAKHRSAAPRKRLFSRT